jgi:hypothetical protein
LISFNRATAYILAALLLVGGGLFIAFVLFLPGPYVVTAVDGEQFTFSPLSTFDKLATAGGGLLLLLAGVFLLALELLGPPARQQAPVHTGGVGEAVIARQSVEERLVEVLERLPGVIKAVPRLQFQRTGTAVQVDLTTDPNVPVPALCAQAHTVMAETLEHDLGLQPGLLRIQVRHAPRRAEADSPAAV